ncbi:hypothetical protein LSH36_875g00001, partial [Paralvinella palmiformis]
FLYVAGDKKASRTNSILECPIDIAFLLDSSSSVTPENWKKTLKFVEGFERRIDFSWSDARIAVVSFGNNATTEVYLNIFNGFERVVSGIAYKDQSRNTAAGLKAINDMVFKLSKGDRLEMTNVVILITNGLSTSEQIQNLMAAKQLKRKAFVFVIGMGDRYVRQEGKAIASKPSYLFHREADY